MFFDTKVNYTLKSEVSIQRFKELFNDLLARLNGVIITEDNRNLIIRFPGTSQSGQFEYYASNWFEHTKIITFE
jgi:hypothetical protein